MKVEIVLMPAEQHGGKRWVYSSTFLKILQFCRNLNGYFMRKGKGSTGKGIYSRYSHLN